MANAQYLTKLDHGQQKRQGYTKSHPNIFYQTYPYAIQYLAVTISLVMQFSKSWPVFPMNRPSNWLVRAASRILWASWNGTLTTVLEPAAFTTKSLKELACTLKLSEPYYSTCDRMSCPMVMWVLSVWPLVLGWRLLTVTDVLLEISHKVFLKGCCGTRITIMYHCFRCPIKSNRFLIQ